jgi:hypothetical protein
MKTYVYTCTFLDYDEVYSPIVRTPGVEYVLFSERRPRFVRGWQWRPLPPETAGFTQSMANRWCKFFPDRLFPDADVTVYADGAILMLGDLQPLLAEFRDSGAAIGLFRHQRRDTVEDELAFCLKRGKIAEADRARGEAQLAAYRDDGLLPGGYVLTQNGVILRRHDNPALPTAMQLWWDEMRTRTRRDQLSLPWVLHRTGLQAHVWPWNYSRANPYFLRYPHRVDIDTGLWFEMFAFVQKQRPGAMQAFYRVLHRMVQQLRGTDPHRRRRNKAA